MISCDWLFIFPLQVLLGLNLKCPLQDYVLNAWFPVCALLWTLSSLWQGLAGEKQTTTDRPTLLSLLPVL